MGLSSILQQIEKKGKIQQKQVPVEKKSDTVVTKDKFKNYSQDRPIDPVVARLKEKRRLEREQKERELREKKDLPPKKTTTSKPKSSTSTRSGSRQPSSQRSRTLSPSLAPQPPQPPQPPKKKLNYNELLKKAATIDHNKLSINLLQKSKSPEAKSKPLDTKSGPAPRQSTQKPIGNPRHTSPPTTAYPQKPHVKPIPQRASKPAPVIKAPLPPRQPSSKIKQRLEEKRKSRSYEEVEEEDDLSDFVEDDEEYDDGYGADEINREEIWAMFNKGKKRSMYYGDDYDSDDMEATGAEIFDEEYQSRLDAEREDRREMEEEKRLQALKRKRLNRS